MGKMKDEAKSGFPPVFRLRNTVQHYAWGRPDVIPRLLGEKNPDKKPWAELWMGDHPLAPSRARLPDGGDQSLNTLFSQDPEYFLSERNSNRLPYLLKLLSAATPLSLQAHPSKEQAERGYAREEASGLSADSPERFYKDKNHKPEIIVALEPFSALCGFRDPKDIEAAFAVLGRKADQIHGGVLASVASRACALLSEGPDALSDFYRWLGSFPLLNSRAAALEAGALAPVLAASGQGDASVWRCLQFLSSYYPGDPGIFAALYLNQIRLERLEGFFVPSGILHSYMGGTGIELMSSSDNVLRGGLSPKKVDMGALIEVLDFAPFRPRVLSPAEGEGGWSGYGNLCPDFDLNLATGPARRLRAEPEMLICLEGAFSLVFGGSSETAIKTGDALFVPAGSGPYDLGGNGLLFRASPGRTASPS